MNMIEEMSSEGLTPEQLAENIVSEYTYTTYKRKNRNLDIFICECNEIGLSCYDYDSPTKALEKILALVKKEYTSYFKREKSEINHIYPTRSEILSKRETKSFNHHIFMGSGNYVYKEICLLHERINYALDLLNGQQQNGGMGTEYDNQYEDKYKQDSLDVIFDVITALGFKDKFDQIFKMKAFW